MALFQETFPDRYQLATKIMRFDITIRLFSLWGYAKDRVYADLSSTLERLKTNIQQVMAEIPLWLMYQNVVENYLKRINAGNTSHGVHLNDLMFDTQCQRSNFITKQKYHEKKYFICVLFTFAFEITKWIT